MTSCSSAMSNSHRDPNLKIRHSFYGGETPIDSLHSGASWKSDVNVTALGTKPKNTNHTKQFFKNVDSAEYYKRYEHDEIPVKDESNSISNAIIKETRDSDCASLTNSDLKKLENRVFGNISQELQTDDSSISSLESNIKFFKTTVQEIFDQFYKSMQDIELYKNRYEEILAKNREDSVADMEDFIKDMIHYITSSDSHLSSESRKWMEMTNLEIQDKVDSCHSSAAPENQTAKLLESLHSVVEAYKNENYLTDSTFDENPSKQTNSSKKEEIFNIYLLSSAPYVQIKMNNRNMLSEINIKDVDRRDTEYHVASAENLKKLAAKKLELEKYVRQQQESQAPDREIPVKVSFAKKNIYLNEDFTNDRDKDDNRSLMTKICSYICKKFRKT